MLSRELKVKVLTAQKNEITEHIIYKRLSAVTKDKHNRAILEGISSDELSHYYFWKTFTNTDVPADNLKVAYYTLLAKFLGISFGLKLMEMGEDIAQGVYTELLKLDPKVENVINDENQHEKELLNLIDEEKLKYTGSVILGLNDALVELTAALSGFTLALQNTKLIAVTGLIMGIAASFSMAATGYLSSKEEGGKNPLKSCVYTGIAYILTVIFLVFPFFVLKNPFLCLALTVIFATCIIFAFNFYVAIAKGLNFRKRFAEMFFIAIGVAALNFIIGLLVRKFLNIDI